MGAVFQAWNNNEDWAAVFQNETGRCFKMKQEVFQNETGGVSNRNNGVFQNETHNIENNVEKDVSSPQENEVDIYKWFGKRPNAKTGVELSNSMRDFYKACPEQFKVDIMEGAKAQRYTTEKRADIIIEWACHMITVGKGNDTFQRLNAELQKWFLRQPSFERGQGQHQQAHAPKTVDIKIN